LAKTEDPDRVYLTQSLRREMGKAKIIFRTVEPKSLEHGPNRTQSFSPEQLAGAIRAAVARGVSGLIVEPVEDPVVLDALYQAENRGVAVLLLDRPASPWGGKSIPCIRYASFTEPGRQIVQSILESAGLLRDRAGDRIVVLHDRSPDPYGAERRDSLTAPLEAAGKPFDMIEFEGDSAAAVVALRNSLAANPRVVIILADSDQGLFACQQFRTEWLEANRPDFLFGGYLAYDYRSASDILGQAAVFADRSVESFAVKTFETMRSLLAGKPVDERVEIPIVVRRKRTMFVPTTTKEAAAPSR